MIAFFVSAALAMEPPAPKIIDDLDRWESGMDAVLAGPPGCWAFTADVLQVGTVHQPPDFFSAGRSQTFTLQGTFSARLDEGRWSAIEVTPSDEDEETKLQVPVVPIVGRVHVESDGEEEHSVSVSISQDSVKLSSLFGSSVSLLHEAVDEWAGRTETAMAQWDSDQQAVMFMREVPVTDSDHRPIRVDVRFPEAGIHADRVDAVWPRVVKVGNWPVRGTIRDAQMHLLSYQHEDVSLPRAESLSLVAGFLGFTMGFEQTLKYRTASPCQKTP